MSNAKKWQNWWSAGGCSAAFERSQEIWVLLLWLKCGETLCVISAEAPAQTLTVYSPHQLTAPRTQHQRLPLVLWIVFLLQAFRDETCVRRTETVSWTPQTRPAPQTPAALTFSSFSTNSSSTLSRPGFSLQSVTLSSVEVKWWVHGRPLLN